MIKSLITYFCLLTTFTFAQLEVPNLNQFATDQTGTFNAREIQVLNSQLQQISSETSTQIVLLMINSLEGESLDMFAYDVASHNKIGSKANDNGVLFLISLKDKKMRIEVGYGLEGALPDALASSIIRNDVAPYFRNGDYYSGVIAGLQSIILAVKGEYSVKEKRNNKRSDKKGFGTIIYIIIFIIGMIISRSRGGRGGGLLLLGGLAGLSGRRGGGFGGGFGGGGSFGGFSGGGGSFGGGGASGGW